MMEMSVEQNSFSLKSVMVNDGTGKHFWVPLCITRLFGKLLLLLLIVNSGEYTFLKICLKGPKG